MPLPNFFRNLLKINTNDEIAECYIKNEKNIIEEHKSKELLIEEELVSEHLQISSNNKEIIRVEDEQNSQYRNLRIQRQEELARERQQKNEELEDFIKPEIQKFTAECIDDNLYDDEGEIKDVAIKALALIIKESKNIEIPINLLKKYVEQEIEIRYIKLIENFFIFRIPYMADNINLEDWIQAYVDTFENSFDYSDRLLTLLKNRNINLYSSAVPKEDIEKIYRNHEHNKDYIENMLKQKGEDYTQGFIELSVAKIINKQSPSWDTYYLEYYLNKEIEERYLKELAKTYKENMVTGKKITSYFIKIDDIDKMTGLEFEHFLGELFGKKGYKSEVTKGTGDQGADLIIEKFGERTVVQAKRYSGVVSNTAIQEAVGAKAHYNCSKAMVITNSYFTRSAMELANSNNVELWDREKLEKQIEFLNLNAVKNIEGVN